MSSLYILIPVSMLILIAAIGAFLWAVDNDQFDDLERQGETILDPEAASSDRDK